jgi:tRNA-specific adenosine deaminase 2
MCAHALMLAGLSKVVYGCDNDKFGGNGSVLSLNLLTVRPEQTPYSVTSGVLKNEAITLL